MTKALFEAGKSLSDINKDTGIDRASVSKRAKKDGWEKGIYQQLIADGSRVKAEISTLSSTVLNVVEKEIEERTKHITFLNNLTLKNLSVMSKKVNADFEMVEHKIFQETVNKASELLLGKEPATVINNTNAQQNIISSIRREIIDPTHD
jgi:predicted transcriptional regulator